MKEISVQELKAHLSAILAEVAAGEAVLVTRHRKPVAQLTAAKSGGLVLGARHGEEDLHPCLSRGSKGRYLDLLVEDRRGGPDR